MNYYRSFLLLFLFTVFGIGSLFYNFIVFPIAKLILSKKNYIYFSSDLIHISWKYYVKFIEFVKLIKLNIKDYNSFKNIKNKVIVATHPSFIDILLLIALIPRSTCFVKNSLTKNFIIKNLVNSFFIPNDIEIEELKQRTKDFFDNNFNVIIFPMGTRHRINEHPKIKKGASLIALNAKKDIVPIKIQNSEDFLFINQPFYDGGKKIIEYDINICNPIEIDKFFNESDITAKRNITETISQILYK